MSKNAFTPDGGPHRPDRVRNVSDGLKRLGEFEAAEMLANYAALLRGREGRNTWEQTAKLIGDDIDSTESLIEAGREAAKSGVADEITRIALAAFNKVLFASSYGPDDGTLPYLDYVRAMHAALEAVAPMLASARVPDGWQPTPANINALPLPIRKYIMMLETEADPAGTIRQNVLVSEENDMLRAALTEALAAAPKHGEG